MRYIHNPLFFYLRRRADVLVSIIFSFVLISCSDTGTEPPPKPAGYQEDIPWPSLADSPWPMYRHDPQNTGRSKGAGPISGEIAWTIDSLFIDTGFAIGEDSTIYFVEARDWKKEDPTSGLVALNSNGTIKWRYNFKVYEAFGPPSPLIDNEGTIYTCSSESTLYAIKTDGSLKWKTTLENMVYQTGINIGKDGTLYIIGFSPWTLYAVNKSGQILWTFVHDDFWGEDLNGMSFAPDGKTLYIPGSLNGGTTVYAFNIENQEVKWQFGFDRPTKSAIPLVDSDGNIYVITQDENLSGILTSLNKNGRIRWSYNLGPQSDKYYLCSIDKFGNIYTGIDSLICLDYFGNRKWVYKPEGITSISIKSPVVIDDTNIIYFIARHDNGQKYIFAINSNGRLMWQTTILENPVNFNFSPAIGFKSLLISGIISRFLGRVK